MQTKYFNYSLFFFQLVFIQNAFALKCPSNFVLVPKNLNYTKSDFCVGKYETKFDKQKMKPLVVPNLIPQSRISRDEARTNCKSLGKGYDLISNSQWQTIARNIELVPKNWHNNKVGSTGGINTGHSDNDPPNKLAAHKNDNKSCYKTRNKCNLKVWNQQRRTHFLSNGEVIWDFAGNCWEFVRDDNSTSYGYNTYIAMITDKTHAIQGQTEDQVPRKAKQQFGPKGDYSNNSSGNYAGLGQAWIRLKHGALRRGGRWVHGTSAGIFAANTAFRPHEKFLSLGYRCVYSAPSSID